MFEQLKKVITVRQLSPLLLVTDHSNGRFNIDDNSVGVFITMRASFFYQARLDDVATH